MTEEQKKYSVIIIGGGIVGVSAALSLSKRGVSVIVLEKGTIAGEQSSRNWGWIRRLERHPDELPLMQHSLNLWRQMSQELDIDIGFRCGGITSLAQTEESLAAKSDWLQAAQAYSTGATLLSRKEIDRLTSHSNAPIVGALQIKDDAYAEPSLAVPAMARLAQQYGAQLQEGIAVRKLYREAGKVQGVVTEKGCLRSDAVILAGGAWSRTFLENEGVSFPQLAVRSSAMRTSAVNLNTTSTLGSPEASIRPRQDGGVTIGRSAAASFDLIPAAFQHFGAFLPILKTRWPVIKIRAGASFFGPLGRHRWNAEQVSPFEHVRTLNPAPDLHLIDDMFKKARTLYPALAECSLSECWAGLIDVMPDELPVIENHEKLPGLTIATGFSGHGFGIGPAAGLLAGQLATGQTPIVDNSSFLSARFA